MPNSISLKRGEKKKKKKKKKEYQNLMIPYISFGSIVVRLIASAVFQMVLWGLCLDAYFRMRHKESASKLHCQASIF